WPSTHTSPRRCIHDPTAAETTRSGSGLSADDSSPAVAGAATRRARRPPAPRGRGPDLPPGPRRTPGAPSRPGGAVSPVPGAGAFAGPCRAGRFTGVLAADALTADALTAGALATVRLTGVRAGGAFGSGCATGAVAAGDFRGLAFRVGVADSAGREAEAGDSL